MPVIEVVRFETDRSEGPYQAPRPYDLRPEDMTDLQWVAETLNSMHMGASHPTWKEDSWVTADGVSCTEPKPWSRFTRPLSGCRSPEQLFEWFDEDALDVMGGLFRPVFYEVDDSHVLFSSTQVIFDRARTRSDRPTTVWEMSLAALS